MITIRRTKEFNSWIKSLRDTRAKSKILVRIDRLADGNPGDVAPCGNGLSEMRIHYGPGYRVYYAQRGEIVVVILCGGDKSTQDRDIREALRLLNELEE